MNDSSANEQALSEDQERRQSPIRQALATSIGHQLLTLVGLSFVLFEIVFVELYSDNFWFSLNISWLGVPVILVMAGLAHLLLCAQETDFACRLLRFIWQGAPPVVYRRWVSLDESGLTFGLRHVRWEVIDELCLTWFGNLQVRSKILSGNAVQPDVVLKIPFGVASQEDQNKLVDFIKASNPRVHFNDRLNKRLHSPIVKGQNIIQMAGAAMMSLVLLDVGHSTFCYLEMLKNYYLAETDALSGDLNGAAEHLKIADQFHDRPLPFSYVSRCFLNSAAPEAGILQARSDALLAMKRDDEAIADLRKATDLTPTKFRLYLRLARISEANGRDKEVEELLEKAIKNHKRSLLPRLYVMATNKKGRPNVTLSAYKQAMADLDEDVFGTQPNWPPGGDRFLDEVFYRDDVRFLLDRLLGKSLDEKNDK